MVEPVSYMGNREGASVCVEDFQEYQKVVDMDADEYGSPRMILLYSVKLWFDDRDLDPEWWLDDLGNVWFEFEKRGEALLFVLEILRS
jgi:hypothetical protein